LHSSSRLCTAAAVIAKQHQALHSISMLYTTSSRLCTTSNRLRTAAAAAAGFTQPAAASTQHQ
jgi:hypothetical protein